MLINLVVKKKEKMKLLFINMVLLEYFLKKYFIRIWAAKNARRKTVNCGNCFRWE